MSQTTNIADFEVFWFDFADALHNMDSTRLVSFSTLPIEIHGMSDDDKVRYIDSDSLLYALGVVVNNGGYYSVRYNTEISNSDLIKMSFSEIEDYAPMEQNEQRISSFNFIRTEGGWKLNALYIPVSAW